MTSPTSHRRGLALPGHRYRHPHPLRGGLGHRGPHANRPGRRRTPVGLRPASPYRTGDISLRSWMSVHQWRVRLPGRPVEPPPGCRSDAPASTGSTFSRILFATLKRELLGSRPWTSRGPQPAPPSPSRSRAGTTYAGSTAASSTAVPPYTRPPSRPAPHTEGVRQNATSLQRPRSEKGDCR